MSTSLNTMEMPIALKMTEQEMLDFYHQKYTNYHSLQMSKETLRRAKEQAGDSFASAAKVITSKQNARSAGFCIDKAKNLDALEARLARLKGKLAKKQ